MKRKILVAGALAAGISLASAQDYSKMLMLASPLETDMQSADISKVDDDEQAAYKWFVSHANARYASAYDVKEGKVSLSKDVYPAVWIVLDRELGIGGDPAAFVNRLKEMKDPMFSDEVISALRDYFRSGGKLLLTNHASVLLKEIGRHGNYPMTLNEFCSGGASDNPDTWYARVSYFENTGVNDKSGDRLYRDMPITVLDGYKCFPLIGPGKKENHNCFFTIDVSDNNNSDVVKYKKLREEFGVEYLAVWPHIQDICSAAISRWLPKGDCNGVAVAIGFGGYEWKQNGTTNTCQGNIEKLTENAIAELTDDTIDYDHIAEPEPPKPIEDGQMLLRYAMEKEDNRLEESVSKNRYDIRGRFTESVKGVFAGTQALRLDGFSSYVEGASMNQTDVSKLTIDLWCAAETYPMGTVDSADEGWGAIAENEQDGKGWSWKVSSRGAYSFGVSVNGVWHEVRANGKFPKYVWNHLVAAVDAENGSLRIYNNGELVGETSVGRGNVTLGNGSVIIGKSRNSAVHCGCLVNAFNGIIDDLTVYSGVDKVAELNSLRPDKLNPDDDESDERIAPELFVNPSRYEGNIYRPQMHAAPAANWGNETHGLYYDEKEKLYHVFYQKNANGQYLSHMHWGHFISDDLINWKEIRTALDPSEDYDWKGCWSGCIFRDDDFNGGKPTIYYTGVDNARPYIIEALPYDNDKYLVNWTKSPTGIAGNPGAGHDFRDPYVFKHGGNYYMTIGGVNNGKGALLLHTYDKASRKWNADYSVLFEATGKGDIGQGAFWEMPVLLDMDGKWLLAVTTCAVDGGDVRAVYWVGGLQGSGQNLRFVPDAGTEAPRTLDMQAFTGFGHGMLSPSVIKKDGKVVAFGIVPDKLSAGQNCINGWSHNYSLPREWTLEDGALVQKPYSGLVNKRLELAQVCGDVNDSEFDVPVQDGRLFECDMTLAPGATGKHVIEFFKGAGSGASVTFDAAAGTVTFDMSRLARIDNGYPASSTADVSTIASGISLMDIRQGGHMQLYVDHSTVDLFVNDRHASSFRIYPTNTDDTGVSYRREGGNQNETSSLNFYALDPEKNSNAGLITGIEELDEAEVASIDFMLQGKRVTLQGVSGACELNLYAPAGEKVFSSSGLTAFDTVELPVQTVSIS